MLRQASSTLHIPLAIQVQVMGHLWIEANFEMSIESKFRFLSFWLELGLQNSGIGARRGNDRWGGEGGQIHKYI